MNAAVALLRERDPMRLHAVGERAGWAVKRSAPTAAAWARAFGLNRSQGCRAAHGDPSSAAANMLATVEVLARNDETTARALVAEAANLMRQIEIASKSNDELRELYHDLTKREHFAEARESDATTETHLDTSCADDLLHAAEDAQSIVAWAPV